MAPLEPLAGPVDGPLAGMAATPSPAEMRAAAEAFESLFVLELLKAARVSPAGGDWQDMIERHLADAVSRGAPFGLSAALFGREGVT